MSPIDGETVVLALGSLGALVGWPLLVHEFEVPILLGLFMALGIGVVMFWFLVRPWVFDPGRAGPSW